MNPSLASCLTLFIGMMTLAASPTATAVAPVSVHGQFRDCGMCPEMIVIPAGRFLIGSPLSEDGRAQDEGPQAEVEFDQARMIEKYWAVYAEAVEGFGAR